MKGEKEKKEKKSVAHENANKINTNNKITGRITNAEKKLTRRNEIG